LALALQQRTNMYSPAKIITHHILLYMADAMACIGKSKEFVLILSY
jgi:hypothetical protein